MTDLIGQFEQLNEEQKRCDHLILCENALQIWTNYVAQFDEISYIESVVGRHQIVDKLLPKDAFEFVIIGKDLSNVDDRYAEAISAMQDDDLEFPAKIELTYYAIYNLFNRYILQQNIDDWLICNHALSAEFKAERQFLLLNNAILQSLK